MSEEQITGPPMPVCRVFHRRWATSMTGSFLRIILLLFLCLAFTVLDTPLDDDDDDSLYRVDHTDPSKTETSAQGATPLLRDVPAGDTPK